MIKAKRVAHGCVATLFYFAQIPSSNPERHPFIRCRTHKNEENVYVIACIAYASDNFFVLPFAEAPQAPFFLFCHLRKLRKRQFFVLSFAEAPQALNFLFCYLRKLRKH